MGGGAHRAAGGPGWGLLALGMGPARELSPAQVVGGFTRVPGGWRVSSHGRQGVTLLLGGAERGG